MSLGVAKFIATDKAKRGRVGLLDSIRILAEGIDETQSASPKQLEILKNSLLNLVESKVTEEEIAKATEIHKFMIRDELEECLHIWFGKSQDTDDAILSQFRPDVISASLGLLEHWSYCADHPKLIVALVILIDQFRRNLYRGTKAMYDCDNMCMGYVKRAMEAGIDKLLDNKERIFLLLVFTHSEVLENQLFCLSEFKKIQKTLSDDDPLHIFETIFSRHVTPIKRFGKFPHRDAILGRETTPQQMEFLADATFRFDLPLVKTKKGFVFLQDGKTVLEIEEEMDNGNTIKKIVDSDEENDKLNKFYHNNPAVHQAAIDQQSFLRIGDKAPDFITQSTQGIIAFPKHLENSWGILFSYPKNSTCVCTAELQKAAELQEKFEERNCRLLAVSTGRLKEHQELVKDIHQKSGSELPFPILEDKWRKISYNYGMLDKTVVDVEGANLSITSRSVFFISPKKKIAAIFFYPVTVGRFFEEILRVLDALQTHEKFNVVTPPDWQRGEMVEVMPFLSVDVPYKCTLGNRGTGMIADPWVKDEEKSR